MTLLVFEAHSCCGSEFREAVMWIVGARPEIVWLILERVVSCGCYKSIGMIIWVNEEINQCGRCTLNYIIVDVRGDAWRCLRMPGNSDKR